MNTLAHVIRLCGQALLVNAYGAHINACSVAHADTGIYDDKGNYVSMMTLKVNGFTLAK